MESFIAGWGLEECLRRAELSVTAGADAILVHSKRSDATDIEAFMRHWGNKVNCRFHRQKISTSIDFVNRRQ
jgi:phosphoenolpyruvate phosphomutase